MGRGRGHRDEQSYHGGLGRALGLTLASAVVWGVAHIASGRRTAGALLLTMFLSIVGILGVGAVVALQNPAFRSQLIAYALRPEFLVILGVGVLVMALVWSTIVIRSYQLARPEALSRPMGAIGGFLVVVMCLSVTTPLVYVAHTAYTQRDLVNSVFPSDGSDGAPINQANPWEGKPRVNILLLGGDAAGNRVGVRTDSMTLASIDTKTANTVMFSLPRNFENAPMPGRLAARFPNGFDNDDPNSPGLLNEVWQYAEDHPDLQPGVRKGQRGPRLLKAVIGQILGLKVDYYILVDMFGFAGIIDAMGGVKIKVEQPIPYGLRGQVIRAGNRRLGGAEAMWYGRSRTGSDDYTRMSRQKCLLSAIAKQANPTTVLTKFNKLARATKRAMATDIPQDLLPPLVDLSGKFKGGAQIRSLQFVPPVFAPEQPNFRLIRKKVTTALAVSSAPKPPAPTVSPSTPGGSAGASAKRKRRASAANSLNLDCPT
jgi:polyisoprenyl-teichoic acid--peptidoglycan teichoic acid transferase